MAVSNEGYWDDDLAPVFRQTFPLRGPVEDKFNIVIVGDGFKGTTELGDFATAARKLIDHIETTSPFQERVCAINFHVLPWGSNFSLSEINDPSGETACDGEENPNPGTKFGAEFCEHKIKRACEVDWCTTETVIGFEGGGVPEWDRIIVLVNTTNYGASQRDNVAVTTLDPNTWLNTALHELGHTFQLGEEYPFKRGCEPEPAGDGDTQNEYAPGVDPPEEDPTQYYNVTDDPDGGKWEEDLTDGIPLPTLQRSQVSESCDACDYDYDYPPGTPLAERICQNQPSEYANGEVGTFEGAGSYHCGLYRPVYDCRMRHSNQEFCPVCQRRIGNVLNEYMWCLAPVFAGSGGGWFGGIRRWVATARLKSLIYSLKAWIALYQLLFPSRDLPHARCQIRQAEFKLDHLITGNQDPCISLPDPEDDPVIENEEPVIASPSPPREPPVNPDDT